MSSRREQYKPKHRDEQAYDDDDPLMLMSWSMEEIADHLGSLLPVLEEIARNTRR